MHSTFKKRHDSIQKSEKKFIRKTTNNDSCIIKSSFLDDIARNGDFLCVDQMITPAHSSFENEHDYRLVLSDIF